jgi:DnaJ-class molecular chaperone
MTCGSRLLSNIWRETMKCKQCNGSGRIVLFSSAENCQHCKGTGMLSNSNDWNNITITIIKKINYSECKMGHIYFDVCIGEKQ